MIDPTVKCSKCGADVQITTALAAPLLAAAAGEHGRQFFEAHSTVKRREEQLETRRRDMEAETAKTLSLARARIVEEERTRLANLNEVELIGLRAEVADAQAQMTLTNQKLREAQTACSEAVRQKAEMDRKMSEFKLTVETAVENRTAAIRVEARTTAKHLCKAA